MLAVPASPTAPSDGCVLSDQPSSLSARSLFSAHCPSFAAPQLATPPLAALPLSSTTPPLPSDCRPFTSLSDRPTTLVEAADGAPSLAARTIPSNTPPLDWYDLGAIQQQAPLNSLPPELTLPHGSISSTSSSSAAPLPPFH
jgi:hypothetical protein